MFLELAGVVLMTIAAVLLLLWLAGSLDFSITCDSDRRGEIEQSAAFTMGRTASEELAACITREECLAWAARWREKVPPRWWAIIEPAWRRKLEALHEVAV